MPVTTHRAKDRTDQSTPNADPRGQQIGALYRNFTGVNVTADKATSDIICFESYASISVRKVSGDVATVTPYVKGIETGSGWGTAIDGEGNAVGAIAITTGTWRTLPDGIFPAGLLALQGDATGVVEVQLKR